MKWQTTLPFYRDEVHPEGSLKVMKKTIVLTKRLWHLPTSRVVETEDENTVHILAYPDDVDPKIDSVSDEPPRSRAADDFAVIRARLEELRKEELKPKDVEALKVMTVDCVWCGAGDTEEAGRMCSGACGH